jgi:hypothetical protein
MHHSEKRWAGARHAVRQDGRLSDAPQYNAVILRAVPRGAGNTYGLE